MTLKPLERCSSPLMGIFRVWPKSERERMHEKRHRGFPAVGCDPSGPPADRSVTGGAGHPLSGASALAPLSRLRSFQWRSRA
jgi:hypothetical protein